MPVIEFNYNDFINLLGYEISVDELVEKLPMIGADLDSIDKDKICMEFFPDRPDLTSVEGIARASRAFFGFETGLKKYETQPSDIVTTVDPSVKSVRPFVTTALVRNVDMTDELITSLMDLQEKLHFGLGRNRKKIAIGVHNFEPLKPPFTYKAVDPDSVSFIPLAKDESMTLREILSKHEKGVDYAHILEGFDKYPLIVDSYNNVLSFPPIINGSLTEVTPFTTDLFIDVTGSDYLYINYALTIVTAALAERGGIIYSTTVKDDNKEHIVPDFQPKKKNMSLQYVNRILGTNLDSKELIKCMAKMGYDSKNIDEKTIEVQIPAWRSDILHEIDLVEDVAIGYGFDNFDIDFPKQVTFGKTLPNYSFYNLLRNTMIGLGFNEVTTFTISNEKDEFSQLGLDIEDHVKLANPIGEEYSCLRVNLLTSLMKILKENRHHPLPQMIFELGIIVDKKAENKRNLAALKIDAKASFTGCKSHVEAVLREIGETYTINNYDHPAFIKGRCAAVNIENKNIGYFGEIHPEIITKFELGHPIIAFELYLDQIKQ